MYINIYIYTYIYIYIYVVLFGRPARVLPTWCTGTEASRWDSGHPGLSNTFLSRRSRKPCFSYQVD